MLNIPMDAFCVAFCYARYIPTCSGAVSRRNPSPASIIFGQDEEYLRAFCLNRGGIFEGISLRCSVSSSPFPHESACPESHLVGSPEFFDVVCDDLFRTIAKRHHTKYTSDSDADAENGQSGTHPILFKVDNTSGNCRIMFHSVDMASCPIRG